MQATQAHQAVANDRRRRFLIAHCGLPIRADRHARSKVERASIRPLCIRDIRIASARTGASPFWKFHAARPSTSRHGDTSVSGCPGHSTIHSEFSANRTLSARRSEEHTSELQSLMRISYAVFCLKKKKNKTPKNKYEM